MAARSCPPHVHSTVPGTVWVLNSSVSLLVCAIATVCIGHGGLPGVAANHTPSDDFAKALWVSHPRAGVGLS